MFAVELESISIFSSSLPIPRGSVTTSLLDSGPGGFGSAPPLALMSLSLGGDPAPRRCLVCSVAQVVEDVKDVELAHTRLCTGVQL